MQPLGWAIQFTWSGESNGAAKSNQSLCGFHGEEFTGRDRVERMIERRGHSVKKYVDIQIMINGYPAGSWNRQLATGGQAFTMLVPGDIKAGLK